MSGAARGAPLRLGTRGSALARSQAAHISQALLSLDRTLSIEEVVIRTRGDHEIDRPIAPMGGKGVFVREIETALLAGDIDLAVHSLKDLPVEVPAGLELAAVPERADPADALVSPSGARLEDLPAGARVATGSPRRAALLRLLRPDVACVPIRGNVDTRLRRLEEGAFDALILARAGLVRLGRVDSKVRGLDPLRFVPAPGQGALAVEARAGSAAARAARALEHLPSRLEARAEQALVRELGGGCQLPLGALARVRGDFLTLTAFLADPGSARWVGDTVQGAAAEPEALAGRLAARLYDAGAGAILSALSQPGARTGPE